MILVLIAFHNAQHTFMPVHVKAIVQDFVKYTYLNQYWLSYIQHGDAVYPHAVWGF